MIILPAAPVRVTPANEHWFFGYYDIPAFDASCSRHLCLRVGFMDRLPTERDVAELYVIDLNTLERTKFAETTAWNFQQACMLEWHPSLEDTVIYNVRAPGGCGYEGRVHNLASGDARALDRPVANVSRDGRYAVSINFDRMFDFRPGYGYAGRADAFASENHPSDDGVYLIDMLTGKSRLIVSLERVWRFAGAYFGGEDQKIMINHITFSPDGERIVFLARNFFKPGRNWRTALITTDREGKELFLLSDFAMASHYNWRDSRVVTFYSDGKELGDMGPQLYELNDLTHTGSAIDPDFFTRDGHNSYSPDLTWMLYDSYPLADGLRELYLYDIINKRGGLLGRFGVTPGCVGDIRCDLHPVWRPDGRGMSFDSVHEGYRALYTMDLTDAMKALRPGFA